MNWIACVGASKSTQKRQQQKMKKMIFIFLLLEKWIGKMRWNKHVHDTSYIECVRMIFFSFDFFIVFLPEWRRQQRQRRRRSRPYLINWYGLNVSWVLCKMWNAKNMEIIMPKCMSNWKIFVSFYRLENRSKYIEHKSQNHTEIDCFPFGFSSSLVNALRHRAVWQHLIHFSTLASKRNWDNKVCANEYCCWTTTTQNVWAVEWKCVFRSKNRTFPLMNENVSCKFAFVACRKNFNFDRIEYGINNGVRLGMCVCVVYAAFFLIEKICRLDEKSSSLHPIIDNKSWNVCTIWAACVPLCHMHSEMYAHADNIKWKSFQFYRFSFFFFLFHFLFFFVASNWNQFSPNVYIFADFCGFFSLPSTIGAVQIN